MSKTQPTTRIADMPTSLTPFEATARDRLLSFDLGQLRLEWHEPTGMLAIWSTELEDIIGTGEDLRASLLDAIATAEEWSKANDE